MCGCERVFFFLCFTSQESIHGDLVTCRNGSCPLSRRREPLPSRRSITGDPPAVFTLGLVWRNWGPGLVADLLGMLSPVVDLDIVFSRGPQHGIHGMGDGAGEVSAGKVRYRVISVGVIVANIAFFFLIPTVCVSRRSEATE